MELYLKVIIFILLVLSFVGLIFYLRKSDILKRTLTQAYEALDEATVERAREAKRNILLQQTKKGFWARMLEIPSKRYIYSGLGWTLHVSFEIWLVLKIAVAAIIYFFVSIMSRKIFAGLMAALLYLLIFYCIEQLLAYRNYKKVDENLIKMVNMMSNFSVTSGEITSILHQISKYLPNPLKSALEECYYDAQTCGDTSAALYAMADKIEHPMFKEFVRNIEICANYTANFAIIIKNSRKIIRNEQQSKKERRAIANDNIVEMFIVSLVLIAALFVTDHLVDTSIWLVLFQTGIGRLGLILMGIIYLIFTVSVVTAER